MVEKITSLKNLATIIPKILDKKSVLIGGCFDLLHFGHLTFLKKAKSKGDILIVALEPDEFIRVKKGRRSIHNQNQRAEILAAINYVDIVIKLPLLKSDKDYANLVKMIKPAVIAITSADMQFKNKSRQAKEVGAKLEVVSNLIRGFSSQKIIKSLE